MIVFTSHSMLAYSVILLGAALLSQSHASSDGYAPGQAVPVSCLNRTIESGEHIPDDHGRLQYVPFATCNETRASLAFRYGESEIITCTIESLSDTQYHLLEYYVHSDAPLTCRVPTRPSVPRVKESESQIDDDTVPVDGDDGTYGDSEGTSYTPLMIALQGTLQQSHLHVWSDINVLLHQISAIESPTEKQSKKVVKTPGYVVAGTAYSLPELHTRLGPDGERETVLDDESIIENARNPWTAGHGTKVVRGEPLTFRFRVRWVSGADSLGWLDNKDERAEQAVRKWLTRVVLFFLVAGIGALLATYYERVIRQRRGARGWHGDGILGRPFGGFRRRTGSMSGVTYGNSGKANGYGGFARTGTTSGGYGYGYGGYGKKE